VFSDNGVSGAKGRAERPGLDELMKAVARRDVDMVAASSLDRLGRSLQGLLEILVELRAKGVDLYLHRQGIDTTTPAGKAMYQMLGIFSEFEREMICERMLPVMARARSQGKHLGRPRATRTSRRPSGPRSQVGWASSHINSTGGHGFVYGANGGGYTTLDVPFGNCGYNEGLRHQRYGPDRRVLFRGWCKHSGFPL
jgi:resolvase-like protein